MPALPKTLTPPRIASEAFVDAAAAVERLTQIYERNTAFLRDRFEAYANGQPPELRVRAAYPFVRITTGTHARLDSRLSYGFVPGPGVYDTTVTRPDLFRAYLTEQIGLLIENHGVPVEVGESEEPIPIHFAYRRNINVVASADMRDDAPTDRPLRDLFDAPDLAAMDDAIADGTLQLPLRRAGATGVVPRGPNRLFAAPPLSTTPAPIRSIFRISWSSQTTSSTSTPSPASAASAWPTATQLRRVRRAGQCRHAQRPVRRNRADRRAPERAPQMPAYHLVGPDCAGTTMINIGTGPSNARNITDHVAVLRPACLADARSLRRLGTLAEARRLRAGARLLA